MPNALKGSEFIYNHPEERAKDLMDAFKDKTIKGIICAIGGDDTIRLLPYIDYDVIKNNPKIFMGYIVGIIVGKPQNEKYYEEYKEVYKNVLKEFHCQTLPVLYNINIGHAYPTGVLPLGTDIEVDFTNKKIKLLESPTEKRI